MRIHVGVAIAAAAAVAASLASVAPVASAQPPVSSQRLDLSPAAPLRAKVHPGAKAGETAGRKAGAKAGAAAGRKSGAKAAGKKGAKVGEVAGRKAGALAGAKAGRAAGSKKTVAGGKKAGKKVGARAGARAGAKAGTKAARATVGPSCGTVVYYKPDGSRWRCTFGDDFTGDTLDASKWRVMASDKFNFGARKDCFMNRPANVNVANGVLSLVARRESAAFGCDQGRNVVKTQYSAGMVSTYEKWSQAYGRFEFRAKFPYSQAKGLQTSLWLWPADAAATIWPITGEIDVAEWYSQWPDRVIPFLHYIGLNDSKATNKECFVDRVQDWHTYLLEWGPGSIRISYDGRTCLMNDRLSSPFDKPFFLAMFGGFGLARNQPTAATPGINRTQFAWVRAWS